MTELIVKINDFTPIASVKKAISLLRGVDSVSERKVSVVCKTQSKEDERLAYVIVK
ncbi:MAG: hypothetical protein MJ204_05685 [Bacteroidales bacterium]|nr:hypothetical protein [Bacteroidales bacterium]